jgi:hypothetical protein
MTAPGGVACACCCTGGAMSPEGGHAPFNFPAGRGDPLNLTAFRAAKSLSQLSS